MYFWNSFGQTLFKGLKLFYFFFNIYGGERTILLYNLPENQIIRKRTLEEEQTVKTYLTHDK